MVNNLVPLSTQRGWIRNSTILVFVGQKLISTKKNIILQPENFSFLNLVVSMGVNILFRGLICI